MKKKSIAIIGLGQFGSTLAKEVVEIGHEVLGVDINPEAVQKVSPYLTHTVIADTTDEEALEALSLNQFDAVIVSIGDNVQANLMTSMLLKEHGIKQVVAKARDQMQGKILMKIGVDSVIYPEMDMAKRLAQLLSRDHVVDYLQLSATIGLIELETPDFLIGKNLIESRLREDYNLSIIAIRNGQEILVPPDPRRQLTKEDKLILIGHDIDLGRLENQ